LEEAVKLRQEIVSGHYTFESAARQFSLSPDATKGGDLGFFAKKEKIPVFDEAFSLSVGTISKPIQSRYGVHLLKVAEHFPQKKLSFQEAKPEIVKVIRRAKEARVYREWATKQLKDSEVYKNEVLFSSIGNQPG
jgi:parvulin-like peptidyl-prolyl isomerase